MNTHNHHFELRRIQTTQWTELRDLRLRALKTDRLPFGSTYEETAIRPDSFWQDLAQQSSSGNKCAIFVACFPQMLGMVRGDFGANQIFNVYSMWVAPEVRSMGVTESLLKELETWMLACGATQSDLYVASVAQPAQRLYTRLGYIENGKQESSPHPGVIEIGLSKDLTT